jgi:hypothetical protein
MQADRDLDAVKRCVDGLAGGNAPGKSGTEAPQSLSGSLLMRTRYRTLFTTCAPFTRLHGDLFRSVNLKGAKEPL